MELPTFLMNLTTAHSKWRQVVAPVRVRFSVLAARMVKTDVRSAGGSSGTAFSEVAQAPPGVAAHTPAAGRDDRKGLTAKPRGK